MATEQVTEPVSLDEPVKIVIQVPDFIELHELYTDALTSVNILSISEIRVRDGTDKIPWTLLRMAGSVDLEVREQYAEVLSLVTKVKVESKEKVPSV